MAKDLNALFSTLDEKYSVEGKQLRPGGGISLAKGEKLLLPTLEDIENKRGARIEYFNDEDPSQGYYVLIAVKRGGEWIFVPSGTFARDARTVDEQGKPLANKWFEGMPASFRCGSDDPFSITLRAGGDIKETLAAAIRSIAPHNALEVVDVAEPFVIDFVSKTPQPRKIFRFKAVTIPVTSAAPAPEAGTTQLETV